MRERHLTGLLLVLVLTATACGTDTGDTTTAAPTTEATTTTVATVDIQAVAADYLAGIPEGWMAVSDITAFKDAIGTAGAYLVDVRTPSEYEEGHIAGAVNIPLRTISDNLDKIPTDRQVFVYCASGYRAALAGSTLHMLGYDNVLIFPPSWKGWVEAGEPVSTETVAAETFTTPSIDGELLATADTFLNGIPDGYLTAGDVAAVKDAMAAGAFLLDVRTPDEYAAGHLPDAINASLRELTDHLADIPTDTSVIVYCGSGHRAALALPVLQMLGFDNTKVFTGSYKAWVDAGEEVVTT